MVADPAMSNLSRGLLLATAGIWVLAQITKGQALQRLGLVR
jgi:hypothetical protein